MDRPIKQDDNNFVILMLNISFPYADQDFFGINWYLGESMFLKHQNVAVTCPFLDPDRTLQSLFNQQKVKGWLLLSSGQGSGENILINISLLAGHGQAGDPGETQC